MPLQRARLKISDYSKNQQKKASEKNRKIMAVSLSLTSMVDMFAILVIFLLTNNQAIEEWVKLDHDIALPKAKTADIPKKAVTLEVSTQTLYGEAIQGKEEAILPVAKFARGPLIVDSLKVWLKKLQDKEGYVNIVADERVPYGAVRRIVSTCQASGFQNINLAVFPRG